MKKISTYILVICLVVQLITVSVYAKLEEPVQTGNLSIQMTCSLPIADFDARINNNVTARLATENNTTVATGEFTALSGEKQIALSEMENIPTGTYHLEIKGGGFCHRQEIEIQEMNQKIELTDMMTAITQPSSSQGTYGYGDLNGDNVLDQDDRSLLLNALAVGSTEATYDLNGDGVTNLVDLQYMSYSYGKPQTEGAVTRTVIAGASIQSANSKQEVTIDLQESITFSEDGIGLLKEDWSYNRTMIPKGSLIFTGSYETSGEEKIIRLYDQENTPIDNGKLLLNPGDGSQGTWIYFIESEIVQTMEHLQAVTAELFKIEGSQEQLLAKTPLTTLPETLPEISLPQIIPDFIHWESESSPLDASLYLAPARLINVAPATLQITMQTTSAAGFIPSTVFTFDKAVKEAYPTAEYVYDENTGRLDIFLSDDKNLFLPSNSISLGKITVSTSASNDRITLSPISVKAVNLSHNLTEVSAEDLRKMSITLKKDTPLPIDPDLPSLPSLPSNPVYNNVRDVISELEIGWKKEVTFQMEEGTQISAESQNKIFQTLRGKDKTLIITICESGKELYSFAFHGKQITNVDTVMNFHMKPSDRDASIERLLEKDADSLFLSFSHKGKLPGTAEVKVQTHLADNQKLYLYHYNEKDDTLDLTQEDILVRNGFAAFSLTHCSKYILTTKPVKTVADLKITASSVAGKGYIKVKWTVKGNKSVADGYQIFRSRKKNSGYGKKPFFTARASAKSYKNTKALKKGRRYYYKVRAYKTIDNRKYYSAWSNKANRIAK